LHWAEQLIARTFNLRPQTDGNVRKGYLHYWIGEYDQALMDLYKAAELADQAENWIAKINIESWRGFINFGKGDYEKSREHFRRWLDWTTEKDVGTIASNRAFYNWISGLMDWKQGRIDVAKARLEELDPSRIEGEARVMEVMSFYYDLLSAELWLTEDKADKVIEALEDTFSLESSGQLPSGAPRAHGFLYEVTLARAYEQTGEIDSAIAVYERLMSFDPGIKDHRTKHPMNYYRLAKLYEKKGATNKAIENYEKFIELWKNCDSQFQPMVQDARERIEKLALLVL
jgi:tetratricopeptide (TPR) repeat protein